MKKMMLVLLCALPLCAQTTTTTTKATTIKAITKTRTTNRAGSRLHDDAARLAALLSDVQSKAALTPVAWKTVANEANALANRIYARARGEERTAAREARTHIRELRDAALKGDAAAAQSHAGMALPSVYKLIGE
jgi:hypothetical protein